MTEAAVTKEQFENAIITVAQAVVSKDRKLQEQIRDNIISGSRTILGMRDVFKDTFGEGLALSKKAAEAISVMESLVVREEAKLDVAAPPLPISLPNSCSVRKPIVHHEMRLPAPGEVEEEESPKKRCSDKEMRFLDMIANVDARGEFTASDVGLLAVDAGIVGEDDTKKQRSAKIRNLLLAIERGDLDAGIYTVITERKRPNRVTYKLDWEPYLEDPSKKIRGKSRGKNENDRFSRSNPVFVDASRNEED